MSENDNQLTVVDVQQQIAGAQSRGDIAKANELYATELDLRREGVEKQEQPSSDSVPADYLVNSGLVTEAELQPLIQSLADDGDQDGARVMIEIGNIAAKAIQEMIRTGRKMADKQLADEMVTAFLDTFDKDDQRALKASVTNLPRALHIFTRFLKLAEQHKIDHDPLPDSFEFYRTILPMCERTFVRLDRNHPHDASQDNRTATELNDRDEFLKTMDAFSEKIARYQEQGRHREANRVYQEQQAWLSSCQIDNRIVGSGGRVA